MYVLPWDPPGKAALLQRLHRKSDIQRVFREGRRFHAPSAVLHARPRSAQEGVPPGCRLAVVAGRQFRTAVARSRARRLLREASRLLLRETESNWDLVLVARVDVLSRARESRLADLAKLLRDANVLCERVGAPT